MRPRPSSAVRARSLTPATTGRTASHRFSPARESVTERYLAPATASAPTPPHDPVTPAEIAATVYHLLGVGSAHDLFDPHARPFRVRLGDPITGVLA